MIAFALGNWRLLLVGGFVFICAAAVGVSRLELSHARTQLATAQQQVADYKASVTALQAATTRQNAAITAIETLAKNREDKAAAAVKVASVASRVLQGKAQTIMGLRPPPGIDECKAAQESFNNELKAERGVK